MKSGAVLGVQPLNDGRERFGIGFVHLPRARVDRGDLAAIGIEGDRAGESLLLAEVGQRHHPAQIDSNAGIGPDERLQGVGKEIVPLQLGVGEGDDLGQERVDAHEPAQRVAEPLLLILSQGTEPVDGRAESGVQTTVVERFGQ